MPYCQLNIKKHPQQQLFIYVNALHNRNFPGKLEVIIVITLINSGGTDFPVYFLELRYRRRKSLDCFSTNIPKGMAVQLPCNIITGRNVKNLSPETVYLILV